jgi:predicted DNA-binding transcriptional regulator AlpA
MTDAQPTKSAPALASKGGRKKRSDKSIPGVDPLLVPEATAAAIVGLSSRKLWELTACGAIPRRKIGAAVRYYIPELEGWISAGCPTAPGSGERIVRDLRRAGGAR